jgi:transcriptional antiterminator NusG
MSEELEYISKIDELENHIADGGDASDDIKMSADGEVFSDTEASEKGSRDGAEMPNGGKFDDIDADEEISDGTEMLNDETDGEVLSDAETSEEIDGEAETFTEKEGSDGASHSKLFEEEGAGQSPKWYVIHTYSGYENMVEQNLKKMVETNGIQDMITDIAIPVEDDIVEKANGKKKVVERKKFPGYVFVKLIHTKQIWYLVTSTRGVTSFVGAAGRAIALTPEEVKRMGLEKVVSAEETAKFNVGDNVVVVSGALEKFIGVINSISHDKKKARVTIAMFGRETSVDLEFTQIEKL